MQAAWLWMCVGLVAAMVLLGGLTRLTGSGLSMVEWHPLSVLPPLDMAQWQQTFAAYQTSPEFRLVNQTMTLDQFRSIFWLEYLHRLCGRLTGLVFAVPLVWFAWRRALSFALIVRLGTVLGLGAVQGLVGWLMVASGLIDEPHVDPYRLAAHLVLALSIFAVLLWTALDLTGRPDARAAPRTRIAFIPPLLIALTITWGALTAGLHAGLIDETFPLMDGRLFPADGLEGHPLIRNAVDNPATVQFLHRCLALTTLAVLTGLAFVGSGALARALRPAAVWAWCQAGLGIATLLGSVPVALASLHQCGAVLLLGLTLRAVHAQGRGAEWG